MRPVIVTFAATGAATATRIAAFTGGELLPTEGAAAALPRLFRDGRPIIGVCAAGILIRLLASALADKLSEELRALVTPGRRMADEWECVASVLLAVVLAHLVGAKMIAWAAFTAFVLMKGTISETFLRAVLRMIGTLLGATLAIWFVRLSPGMLWVTMLATALVGMPAYSAVWTCCTITSPDSSLIARSPSVPSVPAPDRMMQTARSFWSVASERRK